jgi:hypothetical protein
MSYGSEFRDVSVLEKLLSRHPSWAKLSVILKKGSAWPVAQLDEETRLTRIDDHIARGNHKSASTYASELMSKIEDEVKQGWMVPIPISLVKEIRNAEMAPLGIVHQFQVARMAPGPKNLDRSTTSHLGARSQLTVGFRGSSPIR